MEQTDVNRELLWRRAGCSLVSVVQRFTLSWLEEWNYRGAQKSPDR